MLYLLIIAVLLNLFTYMYFTGEVKHEKEAYTLLEKKFDEQTNKLAESNYFSLEYNQNAQDYFDNDDPAKRIDYVKLIPKISDKLIDFNTNVGGNPYTGQEKLSSSKFLINKIKVINHRWIIADYSDGEYWGEVLIKYFINDDETVSFETFQSLLYQK